MNNEVCKDQRSCWHDPICKPDKGSKSDTNDLLSSELQSKLVIDNFKLPIDVTIGNGTFRKGVKVKLVIDRLLRQFEYNKESS